MKGSRQDQSRERRPRLRVAATVVFAILALLTLCAAAPALAQEQPRAEQSQLCASCEVLPVQSHGSTIHAVLFRAPGSGPHPAVLLLHGFPGGRGDVLGLGAELSREGWTVLAMNYRGAWDNEGLFTPSGAAEDVRSALDLIARGEVPGIDPGRIALVGYSFGGWAALFVGAEDDRARCMVGVAPADFAVHARLLRENPAFRAGLTETLRQAMAPGGPIRSIGAEAAVELVLERGDDWSLQARAEELAARPLLVVGGWRDGMAPLEDYVLPLVRAVRGAAGEGLDGGAAAAGGGTGGEDLGGSAGQTDRLMPVILDDTHAFAAHRAELHRIVTAWLDGECR